MDESRKKVALVIGSLRLGGAERMMVNLANALCKQTDLTLIVLNQGNDLQSEIAPGVRTIFLNGSRTMNNFFPLLKLLKREKFDALVSTQIHVNIFCMAVKMFSGIRTKIILREATKPGTHFKLNPGLKNRLNRKLVQWLYPKADAIVLNSTASKNDIVANGFAEEKNTAVILNPVITDAFRKMRNEKVSHRFFGFAPIYISVGRLSKSKNFPLLIEAFQKVLEKKDARLIIVGDGAERKNLESTAALKGIRDKIDFTGQLLNPFSLLKTSDVFVLSSDYEGSPNALIEAMSCGVQLVSTDSPGGAGEVLENGLVGALVPLRDSKSLADAMLAALDKKISPEVLEKSASRFESEKIAAEYLSLIQRVCA